MTIYSAMESDNGVIMEDEKHVIGETTKENIHREIEDNSNAEIQTENEVSQSIVVSECNNSVVIKNSEYAKVSYEMYTILFMQVS